jgi:hypothetical protein
MQSVKKKSTIIKTIAKAGLITKGIVYSLLGVLVFMAAFHINGQSTENADKAGVFSFIYHQSGGRILLAIITLGLICYSIWRGIQAFKDTEQKGNDSKGLAVRARYLSSGLVYASMAAFAIKMLFFAKSGSKDNEQGMARELLSKPSGEWLAGIIALIIIGVGIYQIYYGLSEKYRKHVDKGGNALNKKIVLVAGKIGYAARGIVWLIIGWMFLKAAFHSNSSEAGDTSKVFDFVSDAPYGPYLLGLMGLGLVCYGVFNFIRARYDTIGTSTN